MLFLVLLGNPVPVVQFTEIATAPDSVEFAGARFNYWYPEGDTLIDLTGMYVTVSPACTVRFRPGATVRVWQEFLLDTSLLEAPLSFPDEYGTVNICSDTAGWVFATLCYHPEEPSLAGTKPGHPLLAGALPYFLPSTTLMVGILTKRQRLARQTTMRTRIPTP